MQASLHRQRAIAAYGNASVTVSPAQQIVMLYDGAIKRLQGARCAIEEGRIEERYTLVMKTFDIVNALHGCLDFEAGGEIAKMLDEYYSYILQRLTLINARNDPSICDELVDRLVDMRASWAQIAGVTTPPPIARALPLATGTASSAGAGLAAH